MKNLLSLLLLVVPMILFGQSFNSQIVQKSLASHSQCEKIYVHSDRDFYTGGGDIFFKIYLTDEDLRQSTPKSKVIYVDLISPAQKIIDTKIIEIDKGSGNGEEADYWASLRFASLLPFDYERKRKKAKKIQ